MELIINPNNLKIEGWFVHDMFSGKRLVLISSDVRELSSRGVIINDHEVLSEVDELVRLKPIIEIGFVLIGKQVVSQSGKKYGKVSDFAVETESLLVKKIYAAQPIIKNLTGGNTSIDRTQVIEITSTKIIIDDPTEKADDRAVAPSLVNS
jgi:sporulation protein YlmC with PRC-barrel domain